MSKEKMIFDVENPDHLKLFKGFMDNNRWGYDGCPFVLQWPWQTVPDMIKHQITEKFLKGVK